MATIVALHDDVNTTSKSVTMILRDPLKSKICASDFCLAMHRINEACGDDASPATKKKIAKSLPQMMRAAIRFLTLKQTTEEHDTLIQHLTECQCLICRTARSEISQEAFDSEYLHHTIRSLCRLLMAVLAEMPQTKFRSEKTGRSSSAQPWPQDPDDLLPYGVEDSVEGLALWLGGEYGFEPELFYLAGRLGHFHLPFAREILRAPFKLSITLPLRQAEHWMDLHQSGKPYDLSPEKRTQLFATRICDVLSFFQFLFLAEPGAYYGFLRSHRLLHIPTLKRLAIYLSTLSIPEDGLGYVDQGMTIKDVGIIASALRGMVEREVGMGEHARKFGLAPISNLPQLTDPEHVYTLIITVRRGGCWNISCLSDEAQGSTLPSRLCSNCNILRYCGQTVRAVVLLLTSASSS